MHYIITPRATARTLAALAAILAFLAITTTAHAAPAKVTKDHTTHAGLIALAHKAGLSKANTGKLVRGERLSARVTARGVGRLERKARGITGARIAYSSQYPFPSGVIGSKSSSGSALIGYPDACYPAFAGGDGNSSYEVWKDRLQFVAASRGKINDGTAFYTSQSFGNNSTYEVTCFNSLTYKNGFGVKERQVVITLVYGHGTAVTGRNEQSWTGNVPWYTDGDSRNGSPQYVCTNRWAPTTAC